MSELAKIALSGRLVLLGAGKMGGAMLQGWLQQGISAKQIVVLDPAPSADMGALISTHKISHNPPLDDITDCAVLLIAVKPQILPQAVEPIIGLGASKPLIVSVVAGKTMAEFAGYFGDDTPIIRSIPNTPAAIARGITAIAVNPHVTRSQTDLAMALLGAIGEVVEVADEHLIDVATGVSGSGPAYVFYLTECLAKAGVEAGLEEKLAMQLARATVAGAGELMRQSGIEAKVLRKNVTSPNGTTYAALQELMADDGLEPIMVRAVAAAIKRSRDLAS